MGVSDAMDAFNDWSAKILLFGETKTNYTRYMEVRNWLKLSP